jgi:hypothetical protein
MPGTFRHFCVIISAGAFGRKVADNATPISNPAALRLTCQPFHVVPAKAGILDFLSTLQPRLGAQAVWYIVVTFISNLVPLYQRS